MTMLVLQQHEWSLAELAARTSGLPLAVETADAIAAAIASQPVATALIGIEFVDESMVNVIAAACLFAAPLGARAVHAKTMEQWYRKTGVWV